VAIQLQPQERDPTRFNQAIRELVDGRHNAFGEFTLTPGAATTLVEHPNCGLDSIPLWSPKTANAAAALATMYYSNVTRGSFVVHHANNAQVDRTFGLTVTGG
jgi:hypothetical protein